MTGSIREKTSEINAQIVEAFYEEGLSVSALSQRFGRSESGVNKLLAAYRHTYRAENSGADRERKKQPVDPRPLTEKRSLSFVHFTIGLHISRYMAEHELRPSAFGHLISRSRVQVGNMLAGSHDFTVSEIQRLSQVLGIPYETLAVPPQKAATVGATFQNQGTNAAAQHV